MILNHTEDWQGMVQQTSSSTSHNFLLPNGWDSVVIHSIPFLQWTVFHQFLFNFCVIVVVAALGHIPILQWLHENETTIRDDL
jgi:hypothetical protein